jgi:hypothetical protein
LRNGRLRGGMHHRICIYH